MIWVIAYFASGALAMVAVASVRSLAFAPAAGDRRSYAVQARLQRASMVEEVAVPVLAIAVMLAGWPVAVGAWVWRQTRMGA